MKTIRILILEDDLKSLSYILKSLAKLEKSTEKENADIAVTILSEYTQVIEYVNRLPNNYFDICLLDRDCKAGGSFHVLNLNKIRTNKTVGISSMKNYNLQLSKRGVNCAILKNYKRLNKLSKDLSCILEKMLPLD